VETFACIPFSKWEIHKLDRGSYHETSTGTQFLRRERVRVPLCNEHILDHHLLWALQVSQQHLQTHGSPSQSVSTAHNTKNWRRTWQRVSQGVGVEVSGWCPWDFYLLTAHLKLAIRQVPKSQGTRHQLALPRTHPFLLGSSLNFTVVYTPICYVLVLLQVKDGRHPFFPA